ncbi:ribonuclease H-like domain-containing protein [Tanacetum coccineum]
MVTRSQSGIVKLVDRLSLDTSSISPIPKSPFLALKDPHWCNAMYDDYNALAKMHKFHADGTLIRYKARLVANGSSQQLGVDFDDTFSLVVKLATICTVLSLVVSHKWPIHQLDVKNAFLNEIFIWTETSTSCLGSQVTYLLIYVDDIILTAFSSALLQHIIDSLHSEFDMTDLEALNYFLGISAIRHPTGLFLSQWKYALQLLECAHMVDCNPSRTPVDSLIRSPNWHTLSCFSAEAEYRGVANIVAETAWLCNLLRELHFSLSTATLVYCDNVNDIYMSVNPVQHQRTKHIEIDIHFVRDMVTAGQSVAIREKKFMPEWTSEKAPRKVGEQERVLKIQVLASHP